MKNSPPHSRFPQRLFILVLPALAVLLSGCMSDEPLFKGADNAPIRINQPVVNPFKVYDAAFVGAISNQWFKTVSALPVPPPAGAVVVAFQLNLDGSINDLQVVKSTMTDNFNALCTNVIQTASPFGSWTDDMRKACPDGYRDIHYNFNFK